MAPKPSPNNIAPAEFAQERDPFLTHLYKGGGGYLFFLLILLRHQSLAAGPEDVYDSSSLFYLA